MPEKMLSEKELAYLAGIFDGEGSVCVWVNRKRYDSMVVTVSVGMNDRQPIDMLRGAFGGSIVYIRRANPKHKNSWRWAVKCRKAKFALECLLPYLIIKKRQAEIALELTASITHVGGRVTPEERVHQASLRYAIHKLNQRVA